MRQCAVAGLIDFSPARHGLATHAEKADTLAALPGDTPRANPARGWGMESLQQNKPDKLNITLFFFLSVFLSFIFFTHTLLSFIDRLKGEKAIGIYGYALWGVFFLFIFVLLVKIIFKYTKKNGIIDNLSVILFALGNVFLAHSLLSFLEKNFLKIDTTHVSPILSLVFGVVAFCIKNEFFTSRIILKSEYAALAATDAELEQARAEAAALREENAALKAELEEARAALEKARQEQTGHAKGATVNAQKWKDSVQAACELLVSIMRGKRDNWRSGEFSAELCKRCRDYHTDAARIAWRALPDDFKHGPGRPAEKPGNPEHIETIDDLPF